MNLSIFGCTKYDGEVFKPAEVKLEKFLNLGTKLFGYLGSLLPFQLEKLYRTERRVSQAPESLVKNLSSYSYTVNENFL